MNYQDLERIPGISLTKHHLIQKKQQSLDLHQLDLENKGYSVVTLSLEQTFNDILKVNPTNRSAFKNLFTKESISTTMLQKSFEFFFRLMMMTTTTADKNKTKSQCDTLPLLKVDTNDKWFFEKFIKADEPIGFQLTRRFINNYEMEVDYEFQQEFNRRMNDSIFFNILNTSTQTYDYRKNIMFFIEYICVSRLYHFAKTAIEECQRVYPGFHISLDKMLILETHDSFTNCYDLSLPTIIHLIEKRFRLLSQEDIDNIDACHATLNFSFKRGHVDPRIFKREDDNTQDLKTNINVKKKMVYLNKLEAAEKRIFKVFSKYIPKSLVNIMLLVLEKKSYNGSITLQSLLDTIELFFTEDNIKNILLDLQSHHLSSSIKSISSRYSHIHPINTLANCFTSFPSKATTSFNSTRLHHLLRQNFPLEKIFRTDFYEITTMRSFAQLYKHTMQKTPQLQILPSQPQPLPSSKCIHRHDELVVYYYISKYMSDLVGKNHHTSIMTTYLNMFETKFKYYFRLNIRQKLKRYDVRLDLLDIMCETIPTKDDDDDNMILECDDIIQDELNVILTSMNAKQKSCSSKENYIIVERIYIGFHLFIDFFSSLTQSNLDILQFYLQLLFGIQLQNNNYTLDQKDTYNLIWSISPLFFLKIYSINVEDLTFLEKIETRHFISENYEQFLRLLKTIEFEVFDFKNRPDGYTFFEIEHVFMKRMQSIYYDDNLTFLKQLM